MRHRFRILALITLLPAHSCNGTSDSEPPVDATAVETPEIDTSLPKVAVLTGGHAFDVPNFYGLLRQLPIDAYPQHLEHFISSSEEVRDSYDAILFFGMDQHVPAEESPRPAGHPRAALERITEQGQGVVVLHHALLAWEEWEFWNQLTGFDNRNFRYKPGLELAIQVADADHPVTRGMSDFQTVDEGYVLHGSYDGAGTVLLSVEHEDAMEQVAWARTHGDSRVFCLTLGDNDEAWSNAGFREVLARGIDWVAGGGEG